MSKFWFDKFIIFVSLYKIDNQAITSTHPTQENNAISYNARTDFFVYVNYLKDFLCGGAIISAKHVLIPFFVYFTLLAYENYEVYIGNPPSQKECEPFNVEDIKFDWSCNEKNMFGLLVVRNITNI